MQYGKTLLCITFVFAVGLRPAAALDDKGGDQTFQVVDLGTLPGGSASRALAINNRGDITGTANTASGQNHAVVWLKESGKIIDLHPGAGFYHSEPYGLTAQGRVLIRAYVGTGICDVPCPAKTLVWSRESGFTELPLPSNALALGMNESGRVVGSLQTGQMFAGTAAFFWTPQRGVRVLEPHLASEVSVINEGGWMAGWVSLSGNGPWTREVVFRWSPDGIPHDLGVPADPAFAEAVRCLVRDMNARGDILGRCSNLNGFGQEFLWTSEAGMRILRPFGTDPFSANDLNNQREVVGGIGGYPCKDSRAFYWSEKRGMQELPALGGHYQTLCPPWGPWPPGAKPLSLSSSAALGINNRGQIVGLSTAMDGNYHAVVWVRGGGVESEDER